MLLRIFMILLICGVTLPLPVQAERPAGDIQLERVPSPNSDYEKKIIEILRDISANQSYLNVPLYDGRFLRIIAEIMNAKNVVEIGTSTGYSTIWLGLALKSTGGKLTTYEIDPGRAAIARENFKRAEMDDIITLIEGDAHEEVKNFKGPIDILFLDADKDGYLDYLKKLLPQVRKGGLIIGDNVTPGMADPAFMDAINLDPALETVIRDGVSFTLKK